MDVTIIGVGIVGLNADQGWARVAHLPALTALPAYKVEALANSKLESAEAVSKALGIPHAMADASSLAREPSVDLVAITVKVPHHRELVAAAVQARKAIYCEWPLGNGLAEAEAMAESVRTAGVRSLVGLQARSSPTIRCLRDLVQDGYVGEVLSTTLVGSGGNWGAQVDARNAYTHDRANGATLLTIPFGHAIDALCFCLGEFRTVSAETAIRRKTFTITETGEQRAMATEDQIAVVGELRSGAVACAHYRGGRSRGTNLRWEINGTEGDLEVTGGGGHIQMADLVLRGGRGGDKGLDVIEVPSKYRFTPAELTGGAVNVGEAYVQFAMGDQAPYEAPGFDVAVGRHRLLDAVERSARTGQRVVL